MYWCTISWSFAHSENVSLIDFCIQGGMGIITNSRGVGDDFYLDFLVAWRFGTSLVLGLSVWQKRLSPIVQHMFCVTFATDDIRWYPEIPTQSFSTFSMISMAFSNLVGRFLKGVHRGVSFCERLNVVSSNMAAAETCLFLICNRKNQVLPVVFELKLFILWEVRAPQIAAPHLRKL